MRYYYRYPTISLSPTLILITANLLMFIAMAIASLKGYSLISLLGLQRAGFLARPWIIVTSMFLHAGFWHIFANMLTLYFFGSYLSQLVGNGRFLLVYFIGGILGNLLFLLLASPFAIAVGASGAVFAVGGALAIMRPKLPVFVFPILAPVPLIVAIIGGFIILSFLPYVAWQAHLGGLVTGLIAGYFFRKRKGRYF